MTSSDTNLSRDLDRIAERGGRRLQGVAARRALSRGLDRSLPLLVIVPAAVLVFQLARALFGVAPGGVPAGTLAAIAAIALVVAVLAIAGAAWFRVPAKRKSLAAIDAHLGLEDRLVTADEFLAVERPSGFMQAAIEDAAGHVDAALHAELRPRAGFWQPTTRAGAWVAAGAITVLLTLFVGTWAGSPATHGGDDLEVADAGGRVVSSTPDREDPEPPEQPELVPAGGEEPGAPETGSDIAALRERATEMSDDMKESEGKTASGRSSNAESSSSASESRGTPSNQAQSSKPAEKKSKPAKKKPKKKPAATPAPRKQESKEDSGSTAGRGSSKGSSRNPAVSNWSSKDQVTTPDDEEIEDDEDTEDEIEEQEARGGIQPSLRDRRPPVSRDLRIGFGNQPSPDANGRGGPSQPKKSRGTASLVLGVPIPDRVKGQPNPGKTKITQERIEPRPEEPDPRDAEARRARDTPTGFLSQPDVAPWMRDLVRSYFLSLRKSTEG